MEDFAKIPNKGRWGQWINKSWPGSVKRKLQHWQEVKKKVLMGVNMLILKLKNAVQSSRTFSISFPFLSFQFYYTNNYGEAENVCFVPETLSIRASNTMLIFLMNPDSRNNIEIHNSFWNATWVFYLWIRNRKSVSEFPV